MTNPNETIWPCACGEGKLVKRKNRKTGEYFLGCSLFPKCKYTQKCEQEEDENNGVKDAASVWGYDQPKQQFKSIRKYPKKKHSTYYSDRKMGNVDRTNCIKCGNPPEADDAVPTKNGTLCGHCYKEWISNR